MQSQQRAGLCLEHMGELLMSWQMVSRGTSSRILNVVLQSPSTVRQYYFAANLIIHIHFPRSCSVELRSRGAPPAHTRPRSLHTSVTSGCRTGGRGDSSNEGTVDSHTEISAALRSRFRCRQHNGHQIGFSLFRACHVTAASLLILVFLGKCRRTRL